MSLIICRLTRHFIRKSLPRPWLPVAGLDLSSILSPPLFSCCSVSKQALVTISLSKISSPAPANIDFGGENSQRLKAILLEGNIGFAQASGRQHLEGQLEHIRQKVRKRLLNAGQGGRPEIPSNVLLCGEGRHGIAYE